MVKLYKSSINQLSKQHLQNIKDSNNKTSLQQIINKEIPQVYQQQQQHGQMSSNQYNENIKMQDSLDNLSNAKLRQSSLQKHRVQLIQVKQKFINLLQKLQTSQTRQISLSQIKKLIERNNQPDHLRIYLSILKTLKPNHNSTTKQHQILVISVIAKVFRSNLIDPVEKQPTLLKTCFRVVEILMGFFNDNSNTVQHACARVLLDLDQYCLQQGKYDKQQKISVLFAPLTSILKTGVDKASQATATVCINELLKSWYLKSQKEYLDLVSKQVFSVIMKINSQYHEIFMAAIILIEHKGLAFFQNNKLPNFLAKIMPIIDGTKQGVNSFNSYMCKVNVCKIIQKIAILLKPQQKQRLGDLNIVGSLSKAARNKIIQVQMAATRALKVWKGEPVSQQKLPQRPSTSKGKPPLRSLQQLRDQKKRQRSSSKQNTIKIQTELNYMKQDLQKMVRGGWGANNRAKNFVKRGSGVGGGHYGQLDSPTPPKSNKSHKEHLQQLRSMIKQGVRENKKADRFGSVKQYVNDHTQLQHQQQVKVPPCNINNNISANPFTSHKVSIRNPIHNNVGQTASHHHHDANDPNGDDQFMQVDDSGDQAVYIPTSPLQVNKTKQILKQRQRQKSQQQQRIKRQMKSKDPKFILKQQKIMENLKMLGGEMISQRQLEELMLENNLSEVSDNLADLINQSDLQKEDTYQQQLQLKQNNFIRKPANKNTQKITPANNQNTYNSSLNYTQSRVTNSYKSTLNNNNPRKQQFTLNPNNNQFGQSLTVENTNNNNNKFTSLKQNHGYGQQIEEDIVESYFEESKEKDALPVKAKNSPKSAFRGNNIKKQVMYGQQQGQGEQVQQSASNTDNYQQLIQHPPANFHTQKHFDRKSFINTPLQNSLQHPSPQQPLQTITDKWLRILSLVQNSDINSAFEQAFQMDDPIYLIRLLIITKTPISSLTAQNCGELWTRFLQIYRHNFIAILFVQMFTQADELQLVKNSLTMEEMHQLLLKLYEVSGTSKGKLSFNAAQLYNKIDESLRPGKK